MSNLARVWWGLRVYGPVGLAALSRHVGLTPDQTHAACYRLRERGHATHYERRRLWDASARSRQESPYDPPAPLFVGKGVGK